MRTITATRCVLLVALAGCGGPHAVLTPGMPLDAGMTGPADADVGPADAATTRQVEPLAADAVTTTLDPYHVAPLSALVTVHGVRPDDVREVGIVVAGLDGEDLAVSLAYDAAYATRYSCPDLLPDGEAVVQVPVLGLYPNTENRVHVSLIEDQVEHTATVTITTGPLPDLLPPITIATAAVDLMEPGWNLAAFCGATGGEFKCRPIMYDQHGRIRWVLLADVAIAPGLISPMEPLRDGNLVLALNGTVYEYSRLGREVQRWLLPEGFRQDHDVAEMPDGSLLVCGTSGDASIINGEGKERSPSSQVLEIDRATGAVRNVWDLRQFLDVDRYAYISSDMMVGGRDWFHLNSAVYDPADDSVVVSGRNQGVAKISRGGVHLDDPAAGKELRWILAPRLGWQRAGPDGTGFELAPYLLLAVDVDVPLPDAFEDGTTSSPTFGWPFGQHAVQALADGALVMFDNGYHRDLSTYPDPPFSRGVEYRVTPDPSGIGGTVQQVWEYGRERGPELYSPELSNVQVGPITGNRFVMPGLYTTQEDGTPGGAAKMVEVTRPDNQVVFEAHIHLHGTGTWGGDVCYRQRRVPPYPAP